MGTNNGHRRIKAEGDYFTNQVATYLDDELNERFQSLCLSNNIKPAQLLRGWIGFMIEVEERLRFAGLDGLINELVRQAKSNESVA